jgi:hypothetical protein
MADADMEVKRQARFDPPDLPPIIAIEPTDDGWRGLTMDGMVLNVASTKIPYGDRVVVNRNGELAGYRQVPHRPTPKTIDRYLRCTQTSRRAMQDGHLANALIAIETAMSFAPTLAAHYNRGMILLEMNRWEEGFADYSHAMDYPGSAFARPQYCDCIEYGLQRWRGEDIRGKRLLLIHDHGFGDSIMMLRYVPMLKAMGAEVLLWLPPPLRRLAVQCAPVVNAPVDAYFFCSLIFLLQILRQTPDTIPLQPYLKVDPALLAKWEHLRDRHVTGVAWQAHNTGHGDYPRNIRLDQIRSALPGVALINVQQSTNELPGMHVVFEDFADCAAAMLCCERIVTIDTAAVHLAGAIGHPNVNLLLSHWASWRWLSPLYANLHVCRQDTPGDWDSALAKLRGEK